MQISIYTEMTVRPPDTSAQVTRELLFRQSNAAFDQSSEQSPIILRFVGMVTTLIAVGL